MRKSGINKEFNITLAAGVFYPLEFYPFKFQNLQIFNLGQNDLQVMVNDADFATSLTVASNGTTAFNADEPYIERVSFYSVAGTTIRIVGTR